MKQENVGISYAITLGAFEDTLLCLIHLIYAVHPPNPTQIFLLKTHSGPIGHLARFSENVLHGYGDLGERDITERMFAGANINSTGRLFAVLGHRISLFEIFTLYSAV